MKRGDVISVDFPFSDGLGSKTRPALVVQADSLTLRDVIIAGISGTDSETSVRLMPSTAPVKKLCYVRCEKLFTIEKSTVYGSVGRLSGQTMKQVNECLRTVLGL